jgi:N-acetylmuramoyl-L-alanine amidase
VTSTQAEPTPQARCAGRFVAAPNHEPRRGVGRPTMLLLHYTGMESAERSLWWLTQAASRVSCHYLVDEQGVVTQMVAEERRAWHAGISSWAGEDDINSASIGIEIHNPGHGIHYAPFPDLQMQAVETLCREIIERWQIPAERVLAHSDVAPLRKADPGELFDWHRLWLAGIGAWVEPAAIGRDRGLGPGDSGEAVAELQLRLKDYGFGLDPTRLYDAATEKVVTAFQRHWRPQRVDGRADASTMATLEKLIALRITV